MSAHLRWNKPALCRRPIWPRILPAAVLAGVCMLRAWSPAIAGVEPKAGAVQAPELSGTAWLNVPQGVRISLASRKGKVTVVHFWTFGCINCKRNLPYYSAWRKRFAGRGVEIIGIHTPETKEEHDPAKVAAKVKELGITYPVLLDEHLNNWKTWRQQCWPTVYLVDKHGRARFEWEGELEYQGAGGNAKMMQLIESLLKEP